jgi:hypothetical protein
MKKLGIKEEMKLLVLNPPGGIGAYWKLIAADVLRKFVNQTNGRALFIFLLHRKKNFFNNSAKLKSA